jgi:hypothetical protein
MQPSASVRPEFSIKSPDAFTLSGIVTGLAAAAAIAVLGAFVAGKALQGGARRAAGAVAGIESGIEGSLDRISTTYAADPAPDPAGEQEMPADAVAIETGPSGNSFRVLPGPACAGFREPGTWRACPARPFFWRPRLRLGPSRRFPRRMR